MKGAAYRAGLPEGIFQTKNPNLGKFWWVWQWKMLVYFTDIWSIFRPLGVFYGHLVYFVIWYISPLWYIVPRKIWQPWSKARPRDAPQSSRK
jgi:hypothetical protein